MFTLFCLSVDLLLFTALLVVDFSLLFCLRGGRKLGPFLALLVFPPLFLAGFRSCSLISYMKAILGAIYLFLSSRFYFAARMSNWYYSSLFSYFSFVLSFQNLSSCFILGLTAAVSTSALRLFLLTTVIKSSCISKGAACGTTTLHSLFSGSITLFDLG